jgi:hypothetical protein
MRRKRSEIWLIAGVVCVSVILSRLLEHFGGRQAQFIGLGIAGAILLILYCVWQWNLYQIKRILKQRRIAKQEPSE